MDSRVSGQCLYTINTYISGFVKAGLMI